MKSHLLRQYGFLMQANCVAGLKSFQVKLWKSLGLATYLLFMTGNGHANNSRVKMFIYGHFMHT